MVIVREVNRCVDKTVVTAILVTCVVDQRCSSLSVSHKQMCYFTVAKFDLEKAFKAYCILTLPVKNMNRT